MTEKRTRFAIYARYSSEMQNELSSPESLWSSSLEPLQAGQTPVTAASTHFSTVP